MDISCCSLPACRTVLILKRLMLFVLLYLIVCQKAHAPFSGIKSLHANVGDNATIRFSGYALKTQEKGCEVKHYEILVLETQQLKRTYASKFGNGTAVCTENCSLYKNRGTILVDHQGVTFTHHITAADQSLYCLQVKCSGQNDIGNCKNDAVYLVPVEPVKWVNHTQIGSAHTVKLGETVQGNCVANGNPPPNIKIIDVNTNEIVHEGHTNNLSYVFQVTQCHQQALLRCEATNNPEESSITQLLKVDVKYSLQNDGSSEDWNKERIFLNISITFNALFLLLIVILLIFLRLFYLRSKRNRT